MFVDASAIVAIRARKPEADALANTLDTARPRITLPIALFEAVAGICRKRCTGVEEAAKVVDKFLAATQTRQVPISEADATAVLVVCSSYGPGRGHPAQRDMADCFARAAAKTHRISLPFKGDDFCETDARPAAAEPH